MKLSLLALGSLAVILSTPAYAQAPEQTQPDSVQSTDQTAQDLPQGETQVTPELSQPLEVGQQQANEFFTPVQQQQIVERQIGTETEPDNLIGPPPGSQTSDQVTPSRELNIPIQQGL